MINQQPTELLGESITHWDKFYAKNFQLIFESSLALVKSEEKAQKLTERIFLNLLLAHTEVVVENDHIDLEKEISSICPEMQYILKARNHLAASDLLQEYYVAN